MARRIAFSLSPDFPSKYERRLFVSIVVIAIVIVASLGSTIALSVFVVSTWPAHDLKSLVLVSGIISLPPNRYLDYGPLNVYTGDTSLSITGSFAVSENATSGIEVYVLTQDSFLKWVNGGQGPSYFDSGVQRSGTISASLPDGAGTYHLIYSNAFPVGKTVETVATLWYKL